MLALPVCAPAAARFESAQASIENVLRLADERMALMPAVAAVKWQSKAPITDLPREQAVIKRAGDVASPMGLAPEGVRAVFEVQVRAARESQLRLHAQWRAQGFDFAPPIPRLDTELRPKLDRITTELLRAIYVATPEFSREGFAVAYTTLAAKELHAAGWLATDRQQLIAALAQVRRLPMATGSAPTAVALTAPSTTASSVAAASSMAAPSALHRISASKILRIGTTGDYAPFSFDQDGALSGADIDLAESLATRLNARPVFVRTTWGTMLDDLRADRFDVALGGVSITPARAAAAAFSAPYSSGGKTVIARCKDAKRFSTLEALDQAKTRVIVNPGGTNERYVRDTLHKAQIVLFPDNRAIFAEIEGERADLMITDDVEVELQTHRHPALCRAMPGTLTHADKAVMMPQDPALVGAVDAWLKEAIAAGTPARLLKEHLQ